MDSPVIVDTASKFGRNLDLGFPFDDEGFGRRGDIRSHLDDLAARHPEFADHLLGPAWGDIPFNGSLRNRRRGSTTTNNHQPSSTNHQDEDTRSQASGSSATSAASGASGVSSHGEPEQQQQSYQQNQDLTNTKIPQYGLRNTLDIGQHRQNIMNQERDNRGQRSMSAPPENRQINDEQTIPNYNQQSQNPRFVSRVDISPQINPSTGEKYQQNSQQQPSSQQSSSSQQQQQPQQSTNQGQKYQQQSNVRHIPIFVEGRDTPVIPKNIDETIYHQQQSSTSSPPPPPPRYSQYDVPPEFHSPPQFHRPSHFNTKQFGNKHTPWSGFKDQFSRDTFDHPGIRKTTQQQQQQPTTTIYRQPQNQFTQNINNNNNNNSNNNYNKQQQTTSKENDDINKESTIRKQTIPKDALEKVSLVQQEVDSLTEQVKLWNGNSRNDKQYIYIDEMLTRELIKLDDIDTEGKENVRQARKTAIKSIQDSISLLESKAPLPGQQQINEKQQQQQQPMDIQISEVEKVQDNVEKMEIEKKSENEDVSSKAIPLPPGPTTSPIPVDKSVDNNIIINNCTDKIIEGIKNQNEENKIIVDPNVAIPLEAAPSTTIVAMDVQTIQELNKDNIDNINNNEKNKNNQDIKDDKKLNKKIKKTKKQIPVSTEPIPLPAPETHQT